MGKAWQSGQWLAGHIAFPARKQRETNTFRNGKQCTKFKELLLLLEHSSLHTKEDMFILAVNTTFERCSRISLLWTTILLRLEMGFGSTACA